MNELLSMIGREDCSPKSIACDVETTITDKLTNKKRRLESQLAETNAALEALQNHPDVAKVLTLVGRAIGGNY